MQNLLIMTRINDPEGTCSGKDGEKVSTLPLEEAQPTPALLSPAEREQCRSHGEGLGATALLGQQGAVVLSWMCPSESPVAQPLSHRAGRAPAVPAVPPKKPSSAGWQQHWEKHGWFKGMHETQQASITACHPFYAFPTWEPIEKTPPLL